MAVWKTSTLWQISVNSSSCNVTPCTTCLKNVECQCIGMVEPFMYTIVNAKSPSTILFSRATICNINQWVVIHPLPDYEYGEGGGGGGQ